MTRHPSAANPGARAPRYPWIETKRNKRGLCHAIRVPGYSRKIFLNHEELRALAAEIDRAVKID